ncbi:hypothetical protein Tco_0992018 [Tanacetum coccineum]|uniref:Retrotransposon Copia-like N-terminal domain-containing protein n=1 Tax=Tanacetum coccineum TaxID=301880 RepID=A0ABQ5F1N8_9ASTR
MSILHAKKLIGSNFTNWHRNLRIVLMYEKKLKLVEHLMTAAPDPETTDPYTIDKYYESVNIKQEVACLMLSNWLGRGDRLVLRVCEAWIGVEGVERYPILGQKV